MPIECAHYIFVGEDVVVTEKLDGGSTLLHAGKVYARSVSVPSDDRWMAMVQKHHAWKARESDIYLYGEDIYDVHGIAYEPVVERTIFHAIALRSGDGAFATFADAEAYATHREPPVVPILFRGRFCSVGETSAFMEQAHDEPSMLGGERESGFPVEEFQDNVCDRVRIGHVQSDEHWTRNWRPCRIAPRDEKRHSVLP